MPDLLRNAWYMAGWSDEVGEQALAREISGERLFFYRAPSTGAVVAMVDRCPHRFVPLSLGRREGDRVICGYHGLEFGPDGRCVRNPYSERIPGGASVRTFPAVERDGLLWVWLGAADKADPQGIPDFSFVPDRADNRTIRGYTMMRANYEYGTDNLMDLSHIEFVHTGSFAGEGVIFAGRHSVEQEGDTLHSKWWMPNIAPPSMAQGHVPADARVDHWLDMRWDAPASMRLKVGVCPAGEGRQAGFEVEQAHILTPANEHETHYFWSSSRDRDLDNPELDTILTSLFRQAFDEEDKPIIEASYENMRGRDFWAEKPLSLGIDQGGTRARRIVEKMLRLERQA